MARSNQQKQKQKQRKLRQRKAKVQKKVARSAELVVPELSAKTVRKLEEIQDCWREGEFKYAIQCMTQLAKDSPKCPAVAESEYDFFEQIGRSENACSAAKRFVRLMPQNPDAILSYAMASLVCSRVSIALLYFQKFLERWPTHESATKARKAIEVCDLESRNRVAVANESGGLELDFEEGGLEFYARHEESLEQMADDNMGEAIALLERNLEEQPKFMSSRNNLVICRFYHGDIEHAVGTARETCRLSPENRFAKANLIKFEFLSGNQEVANELADTMIVDPPTDQDPYTAMMEALSFLGRDEDIIAAAEILEQVDLIDSTKLAAVLHYSAVAHYRMGDHDEASRRWEECLGHVPNHYEALENVSDLETEGGNAAWSESLGKWLPRPYIQEVLDRYEDDAESETSSLAIQSPIIAALVPALLDRGDPDGREFAVTVAGEAATPAMLDALKEFAYSNRGPDSLRHRALRKLQEEAAVGAGPHRFFSQGKWTDIQLFCAEISYKPLKQIEAWKSELLKAGHYALDRGDFETAEKAFQSAIKRDPKCQSARFNLANLWEQRRDGDELEKAHQEVRKLHAEDPGYVFAAMTVAMFEAEEGNYDRADKLLNEVFQRPQLHVSEAMMLFVSQVQISLMRDDVKAAEAAMSMFRQVSDDGHATQQALQQKIDEHKLLKSVGLSREDILKSALNLPE